MEKFSFSSKADTLLALSKYQDLHIPEVFAFTVKDWQENQAQVIKNIQKTFNGESSLAVRSSCRKEDSYDHSSAGAFLSLLNVRTDTESLKDAITKVIASYGEAQPDDQVLVQPMIAHPRVTGVIMTRVLTDGSPYYVLNYDDESGATDTITGGTCVSKMVYVYRGVRDQDFDSPRLRSFVNLARKLEKICGSDALDIEFCLDAHNVLHLLQVRPICSTRLWPENSEEVAGFIDHIASFVEAHTNSFPDMVGQRSILGVMPDWNPA